GARRGQHVAVHFADRPARPVRAESSGGALRFELAEGAGRPRVLEATEGRVVPLRAIPRLAQHEAPGADHLASGLGLELLAAIGLGATLRDDGAVLLAELVQGFGFPVLPVVIRRAVVVGGVVVSGVLVAFGIELGIARDLLDAE